MERSEVYARALIGAAQGEKANPRELVKELEKTLKSRGETALVPRIQKAFERLSERNRQSTDTVLVVAKEEDVKKYKSKISGSAHVRTVVDSRIIGGYRVESGSKHIDASYKRALLNLYRKFTN